MNPRPRTWKVTLISGMGLREMLACPVMALVLAGCGSAGVHHHATSKTVHTKTSSGNGAVPAPATPPISASQAETAAENKVGSCIEEFYGNQGFTNITPSYLGGGLVKFHADGDASPDGSVIVRVTSDGTVQGNSALGKMGCQPGSYTPVNEPNYNPTPATYDWTCSLSTAGVNISVTATGNGPVQTDTLGVETEMATYFDDGNVMYQWGPGSYGIATSHLVEPGQTWSVFVPVPVFDNSHFQIVDCRVVSR